MATLFKEDGTQEEIAPADGVRFSLTELQTLVEGSIELVSIAPDPRMMFVNENGWAKGMTINRAATALYRGTPPRHEGNIVGPAVVMTRREAGED